MSQEQLNTPNGQEVAARQYERIRQAKAATESIDLRKWAVDLAATKVIIGGEPADVVKVARAIYDFVTEPARQP